MEERYMHHWLIDDNSVDALENLNKLLISCAKFANSGYALIGLGEVIETIKCLVENSSCESINVGLSIGFRHSSEGMSEGIFYGLRINDDEFYLDKLNTQNMGYGTDHSTETFFIAKRHRSFDSADIYN